MLTNMRNIYKRYEAAHLIHYSDAIPIIDRAGDVVGHVDRVHLSDGRLHVSGWAFSHRVRLVLGGAEAEDVATQRRPDVATALGCDENVGFELSVPGSAEVVASSAPPGLTFLVGQGQSPIDPISLPLRLAPYARQKLQLRFLYDFALTVPAILRWYLTGNLACRIQIKTRLRLSSPVNVSEMETQLFQNCEGKVAPPRQQKITIVLPIFNAFDLLQKCLSRVDRYTDLPFRLILIEDCSSDERIRPFLREWVRGHDYAELVENPENLGFIGAVNRGLRAAMACRGSDEGPVILLNSDALVPQNWASRLIRPFEILDGIASVTPMSNDAEIMSVPVICQRSMLKPGQGDAIDRIAGRFAPDMLLTEVPSGVGFCMAMGRDWLGKLGTLDKRFGKGYGEEVDWCQKIVAMGGRHLALPGLFVEHHGGESFGSATKQALIARNGRLISRRYPHFDRQVQEFISVDPLETARLALGLAWAGSRDPHHPISVYLGHSLGGGADIYLEHRVQADLDLGRSSVILRVGGKRRWRLELVTPQGRTYGQTDDFEFITRLLEILPKRRIIYSCGVGDSDPLQLPELLLSLMQPQDSSELLFHDFFPLSPSYTLLDSDGIYRGPVTSQRTNKAHQLRRPNGNIATLPEWQAAWRKFAKAADMLVFSHDSVRQVQAVWPDLNDRIVLRPHSLVAEIAPIPAPPLRHPVIGVLGNIGFQKGALVLNKLVRLLQGRLDAPQIVLIGNIDPAYALPASTSQHGSYALEDLSRLTRQYGITHWLIPSIWPETFCYSVHEALATGLPVMAFDIGGQGDAVRTASNGVSVPFGDGTNLAERIDATFELLRQQPVMAAITTCNHKLSLPLVR
ncbi:MAG: glycosyltransferase [Paracoccus sp. (in: a-proteobacteria)]